MLRLGQLDKEYQFFYDGEYIGVGIHAQWKVGGHAQVGLPLKLTLAQKYVEMALIGELNSAMMAVPVQGNYLIILIRLI